MDNEQHGNRRPPTPMWVKLFALAGLMLLGTFVVLHATGTGLHHGGH